MRGAQQSSSTQWFVGPCHGNNSLKGCNGHVEGMSCAPIDMNRLVLRLKWETDRQRVAALVSNQALSR